jgi:hypothetical protein
LPERPHVFVRDGTIPALAPASALAQGYPQRHGCPSFVLARDFPLNSWACAARASLAHIVFHSLCAKPACASAYACCLKKRRRHFSLTYQELTLHMCACAQFCPQKMWRNRGGL